MKLFAGGSTAPKILWEVEDSCTLFPVFSPHAGQSCPGRPVSRMIQLFRDRHGPLSGAMITSLPGWRGEAKYLPNSGQLCASYYAAKRQEEICRRGETCETRHQKRPCCSCKGLMEESGGIWRNSLPHQSSTFVALHLLELRSLCGGYPFWGCFKGKPKHRNVPSVLVRPDGKSTNMPLTPPYAGSVFPHNLRCHVLNTARCLRIVEPYTSLCKIAVV